MDHEVEEEASDEDERMPSQDEEEEGGEEEVGAGDDDEEGEQFDITLPATHSYMGGLSPVGGRAVLEAGWRGRVPALAQRSAVFPGDTVPLRLAAPDHALVRAVLRHDKLFVLLFADESGAHASGLGAMCEVFEAGGAESAGVADGADGAEPLSVKARAIARVRAPHVEGRSIFMFDNTVSSVEVEVLPEYASAAPLRHARLDSLARWRDHKDLAVQRRLRRLQAAVSAWPAWLLQRADHDTLREKVAQYFAPFHKIRPPSEPSALSYWVCSNVVAPPRARLALLREHDAAARTHAALALVHAHGDVSCARCDARVSRLQHALAMSSDGLRAHYTNIGGYVHDVVTVSSVSSARCSGAASAEFSWFPGYSWTILVCAACDSHLGWRFDALKPSLRPKKFYGLSRGSIRPTLNYGPDDEPDAAEL